MTGLRPFFTYFGSKFLAAAHYPAPLYNCIVEPFAGSAGYALRHPDRDITLVEKSEPIAAIWRYLVRATPAEILALPLLDVGQSTDSLRIHQEARWLIGMWVNPGSAMPKKTLGNWRGPGGKEVKSRFWGIDVRARIARQVERIRHWVVIHGNYDQAPDVSGTWFIDPPYEGMGKHYPCGADEIDFAHLAEWSRARRGQVLVCEQQGANWLPFAPFGNFECNQSNRSGRKRSAEALWMNEWPGAALWLPAKRNE